MPKMASERQRLQQYAAFIHSIRQFFAAHDVLEVSTPILSHAATTDVFLDSFVCRSEAQPQLPAMYLHTSPELAMKKRLVAGSGDIYQICPVARAGEDGRWHRPCFTMLEWYRVGYDLEALVADVARFFRCVMPQHASVTHKSYQQIYQQVMNVENIHALSDQELLGLVVAHCPPASHSPSSRSDSFDRLMTHVIEPHLQQYPCAMIDHYPACQAALAKTVQRPDGTCVARRVEVYVHGIECGNGFEELTDPEEQRRRFQADQQQRHDMGLPVHPMDASFLEALAQGLPDCAGIAMGIDRLWALAKGQDQLED